MALRITWKTARIAAFVATTAFMVRAFTLIEPRFLEHMICPFQRSSGSIIRSVTTTRIRFMEAIFTSRNSTSVSPILFGTESLEVTTCWLD